MNFSKIFIENFKSFNKFSEIDISDLSIFMGANSSGKSTAIQALLVLKQTIECNSPDIDLLLSGKYVTLGDFQEVVNNEQNVIRIGLLTEKKNEISTENKIVWSFSKASLEEETIYNQIELSNIEIEDPVHQIILNKSRDHFYNFIVDGCPTCIYSKIHNLQIENLYLEYNIKFNLLFHTFLKELLQLLIGKKAILIDNSYMMSTFGLTDFCSVISNSLNDSEKLNIEHDDVASKVISLINQYKEKQLQGCMVGYIPEFLVKGVINLAINNFLKSDNTIESISALINKYQVLLNDFKVQENDESELQLISTDTPWGNEVGKESPKWFDIIKATISDYDVAIKEIMKNVFYLGPIREKPLGLYHIGFESIPKYVGKTGLNFASVLLHENKRKEYIVPGDEVEQITLLEALDAWSEHIRIANQITVEQNNSFGINVSVENNQRQKADIMNVGIGVSQVLPVLITGLLSEENEVLIFEQPELHLHPFSQSRLADFFIALAKNNRKVIIETHSEYFILRLRYNIISEHIESSKIALSFFYNKNGTIISKGALDSFGNIQYPDDFKDETQRLLDDLMHAAIKRESRNEKNTN